MTNQRFYVCNYCHKDYEPKRRRIQKYCSQSCRSKAYHARTTTTKTGLAVQTKDTTSQLANIRNKAKIETMSPAGIGNATVGALAADGIKALMTHNDDKPATKGDIKNLVSEINGRYHFVTNLPHRYDGALPYFDLDANMIVYFHRNQLI